VDAFGFFWLAFVAFFAFWQAAWGWRALKTGTAILYFQYEFGRSTKPFEYWMIVALRAAGLIAALAMFFFGLEFWMGFDQ
jgi:hypothetical protein